ncbi:hypothetical protein QC764_0000990 [Podospora pseudoanserina]|uniref:NmrA-like domain-containing protein n=1 Tax=Podospora pseudoanserina TaxID=2609844 RepID=A0ABR0IJR6_9PEZI|nr:hypothetical protein QC764_0000990 [Podospora pseudoanserina]
MAFFGGVFRQAYLSRYTVTMSGIPVFFIGASGHIGAAVLQALHAAHPELPIRALVRQQEDVDHLESLYQGSVACVLGTLEDVGIVAEEAARAQLVINCAPDFALPLPTLLPSLSSNPHPQTFLLQTSGAARIWPPPSGLNPHPKIWSDLTDLSSLPTDTTHAAQDITVSTYPGINTAIISPTFVIGKSPSVRHKHPIIFPDLMHVTRQQGQVFVVEQGKNLTTFVDTEELAELYVLLVGDALRCIRGEKQVDENIWGEKGYFFAGGWEVSMREFIVDWLLPVLEGNETSKTWLRNQEGKGVKGLGLGEVVESILGRFEGQEGEAWSRHIAEGFGTSMRIRGDRGRRYLGWEPTGRVKLGEAVEAVVRYFEEREKSITEL